VWNRIHASEIPSEIFWILVGWGMDKILNITTPYIRKLFSRKPKVVIVDEVFPEFTANGDLIIPPFNPVGLYSMKTTVKGEEIKVKIEYTRENVIIVSQES